MRVRLHPDRFPVAVLVAAMLAATGMGIPRPAVAKGNGSFSGGASLTQGSVLRIENRRGDIVIRQGTGNVVQVSGRVRDTSDQGDLSGRYTPAEIIVYLERRPPIVQDGNTLHIGAMLDEDFHLGVAIDYDIVAPSWVVLEIEAELGTLEIHGVGQRISIERSSGTTRVQEPPGRLDLKSKDGPLQVIGTPREEWSLKSTAGNVDVFVPDGPGFAFDAESKAGTLASEFPLGEHKPGRFDGALNGGGARIHIRTESGIITLRRG